MSMTGAGTASHPSTQQTRSGRPVARFPCQDVGNDAVARAGRQLPEASHLAIGAGSLAYSWPCSWLAGQLAKAVHVLRACELEG